MAGKSFTTITLDRDTIERARKFALDVIGNEKVNTFDGEARDRATMLINNFIGRLGEEAVKRLFLDYGADVILDYNLYDHGEWDKEDISYNGWSFDVKSTKVQSKNFLIELNKLRFREEDGELPHFFIVSQMAQPVNYEQVYDSLDVNICGYMDSRDLVKNDTSIVKFIPKGSNIPGTSAVIGTDNYAVAFSDLPCDWDHFFKKIVNEKPFSVGRKEQTIFERHDLNGVSYSLLLSGDKLDEYTEDKIKCYLDQGIKVILFGNRQDMEKYKNIGMKYGSILLFFYVVDDLTEIPSVEIKDGKNYNEENLSMLAAGAPSFNKEQYQIEHYSGDNTIIVQASAGTGKTYVMLDRIMYLLTMRDVTPSEICMITFTNEAADSMRAKLTEKLTNIFERTAEVRYLRIIEEISSMQISTIDSFFKSLIKQYSFDLGLGTGVAIRGLAYEKHNIVRRVINHIFKGEEFNGKKSKDYLKDFFMTEADYVKFVEQCWSKLSGWGVHNDDLTKLDFGSCKDEDSSAINKYLKKIIVESDKEYSELKKRLNVISVDDISGEMQRIVSSVKRAFTGKALKYLFIDEFQDTDNSQIEAVAWLKKVMGCQLFVVGDIKQSIYRFRGAESSAFKRLKNTVSGEVVDFKLIKNYRTNQKILDSLNVIFDKLGQKKRLQWESKAETGFPDRPLTGKYYWEPYSGKSFEKELIRIVKNKESGSLGILARRNSEVDAIAAILKKHGIECLAKRSGGFYTSAPVIDMLSLLGAVLYRGDSRRLFDFAISSYSEITPDADRISELAGQTNAMYEYLEGILENTAWKELSDAARNMPAFTFIRKAMAICNPLERFYQYRKLELGNEKQAEIDKKMYRLNLTKLIHIIYSRFSGQCVPLNVVYDFLLLNMNTNSEEDLEYIDQEVEDVGNLTVVATVHKSKGMQYDNVIVLFKNLPMVYLPEITRSSIRANFILYEAGKKKRLGWYLLHKYHVDDSGKKKQIPFKNDYFDNEWKSETRFQTDEEARLLYVALTRVKNNLVCLVPQKIKGDSWGSLLCDVKGGVAE